MTAPRRNPSTAAPARPASTTLRDTVIVLSTTLLGLIGSLATQSCLAWLLEPAGRGAFAVCAAFAAVAPVVVGLATERGAQYQLIARHFSVGRAASVTCVTALASAALAAAIGWALIGSSLAFFAKADASSFRVSLLLIPLVGLSTALGFLLVAVGRFGAMGAINLAAIGVNLLATLLFVGWLEAGVDGALWALIASYGITVALQASTLRRIGGRFEAPRLADFRRVLSYGVRYYVARLGNVVNVQIGMLMMAWLGTPEQIGLFAAASVLVGRVMVVPDSLDTALQPRVGPDANGQPALVATASRTSLAIVGVALVVLLATSPVVVPLLLSPAFAEAVPLLWLMAPGLWIKSVTKPMTAYFIGMNRPGVVSLATASELAGNAIGMPVLFARAGLPGAALATSIGCAMGSLVMLIAFVALSGLGPRAIWTPRRADLERLRGAWEGLRRRRGAEREVPVAEPGGPPS